MSKSSQPAPNVFIQQIPLQPRPSQPQLQSFPPQNNALPPYNAGGMVNRVPPQYSAPGEQPFSPQPRPTMPPQAQYVQPKVSQSYPLSNMPGPPPYQHAQQAPPPSSGAVRPTAEITKPLDLALNNIDNSGPIALCQLAGSLMQDIVLRAKEFCGYMEMVQRDAGMVIQRDSTRGAVVDEQRSRQRAEDHRKRSAFILIRFKQLNLVTNKISQLAQELLGGEYDGYGLELVVADEELKNKFDSDPKIRTLLEERKKLVEERDVYREKLETTANFTRDMLRQIESLTT